MSSPPDGAPGTGGPAAPAEHDEERPPSAGRPAAQHGAHQPAQPGAEPPGAHQPAQPGRSGQDQAPGQLPGLPPLFFSDHPESYPDPPQPPAPPGSGYGQSGPQPPFQVQQAPPQTGTPPAQRPPARRRTARPDRELRQRAIAALVFGLIALFSLGWLGSNPTRGLYLLAFSAIVGLAACVIGITAIVKARRTEVYRPMGAVGGIISGAIAVMISLSFITVYLRYPTQTQNLLQCLQTAHDFSATQACDSHFYRSTASGVLNNADGAGHLPGRAVRLTVSGSGDRSGLANGDTRTGTIAIRLTEN